MTHYFTISRCKTLCLAWLATLTLLSGCGTTLEVKGEFPTPLIDPLSHSLGVNYLPQFSQFEYVEQSEERDDWKIGIGNAQKQLFNQVLSAMFSEIVMVDTPEAKLTELVLQPTLEEFQYNTPRETNVKMYEVWMKYNLKVYNQQGQLIADWIMTAYGKTPSAFMQTDQAALNEALVVALRDAGARMSLSFRHVPEIKKWLAQQQLIRQQQARENAALVDG